MTSSSNETLERIARRVTIPEPAYERLLRRRDRKRRKERVAAGIVGIAVFVAAVGIVTTGPFDQSQTAGVSGGQGTGPLVEPATIGTVTRSGAGCALEIVAKPIFPGAGRLTVVNEMNRWVSFELFRFDPQVLTFAQFEAIVVEGEYWGPHPQVPPGTFVQVKREVGPGASGTITDNFTTGAFAIVCLDQHHLLETNYDYWPFALVGPIVVTGPAETGPADTGPVATNDGWNGVGLPPEDAVPSTPVEGEVIAEFRQEWPPGGRGFVYVYADGRVIRYDDDSDVLTEQRLTPEGIALVRSGDVQPESFLPPPPFEAAGAWADAEPRQYMPARYAVCYAERGFHIVDPSSVVRLLPARAEALLHGKERTYENATLDAATTASVPVSTCFEVTTEEARVLDEILSRAGFEMSTSFAGPSGEGLRFLSPDGSDEAAAIVFAPLLPQGVWAEWCGGCG